YEERGRSTVPVGDAPPSAGPRRESSSVPPLTAAPRMQSSPVPTRSSIDAGENMQNPQGERLEIRSWGHNRR
ncbi:hypothetical protein LINPERHAP2_LOCUS18497, partial [Linum perenne]